MDEIMSLAKMAQLPGEKKADYRKLCKLLDNALNVNNAPDYGKFSEEESRKYAIGRFGGFLRYGVHNYVADNPLKDFDGKFKDYLRKTRTEPIGIKVDHPILNAYYRFARALDLGTIKKYDTSQLKECCEDISFLFEEFLTQGARAFATNTYRPIPNKRGFFAYHCVSGPMRKQQQQFIMDIIDGYVLSREKRTEKLQKEIEEVQKKENKKSLLERISEFLKK